MEKDAARNGSAPADSKIRINFDVPSHVNDCLVSLTERTGTTKADLLRRAILLMEAVVDEKERVKGSQLAVVDKDMKVVARIVGF